MKPANRITFGLSSLALLGCVFAACSPKNQAQSSATASPVTASPTPTPVNSFAPPDDPTRRPECIPGHPGYIRVNGEVVLAPPPEQPGGYTYANTGCVWPSPSSRPSARGHQQR